MRLREVRLQRAAALALLLLSVAVLVITGCDNPRKAQIKQQLSELATECDRARQSVSDHESALETMRQRLTERRSQLTEYNASVQAYMLDHKMAVAALAAGVGGLQMASNNAYSDDAKQMGSAIAIIAALWAINNMDEVSDLLETLNQADAHADTLKNDITQTAAALQQEERSVEISKEQLQALIQRQTGLQQELSTL